MPESTAKTETQPTLAERLRQRIRREGPLSFRDWMDAALYDPQGGYYQRSDLARWGHAGDYRTSAERSPLFAATLAGYFAALYEEMGAPPQFDIIEAGAGDGSFARGVLETLRRDHAAVFAATRYVIDEISNNARRRIKERLSDFADVFEFASVTNFAAGSQTGIVFSNELLDAFPVHRVTRRGGRFLELHVGLNEREEFVWSELEPSTPQLAEHCARQQIDVTEGQTVEVNLAADEWIARAASLLVRGFVVIIDYGDEAAKLYQDPHRRAGTLRAFRQHQFADDILANPGEQDLTATIDWTHIRRAGESAGLHTVLFTRQDDFLLRAGLLRQLEQATARATTEAESLKLRVSTRDLILPGGMSESFQVLVQEKRSAISNQEEQTAVASPDG